MSEVEILPPDNSGLVQIWRWRVTPNNARLIKFGAVLPALAFAGWLLQNFLQLRGVVNLLASRIVLGVLALCIFFVVCVLTIGLERKLTWRLVVGVVIVLLTLGTDRLAPIPQLQMSPAATITKPPTATEIAEEVAKKVPRQHDMQVQLEPQHVGVADQVDAKVIRAHKPETGTSLQNEKPPTLPILFKTDFPGIPSFSDNGFDLKDSTGKVGAHVSWRLFTDFPSKNEFIAFYVPAVNDEVPVCLALIDTVHAIIDQLSQHFDATGGYAGETTSIRELTFSGRVFIYHEWPLSNKQKADIVEAYSAKGFDVQFRGVEYLGDKLIAWHQQHDEKPAHR